MKRLCIVLLVLVGHQVLAYPKKKQQHSTLNSVLVDKHKDQVKIGDIFSDQLRSSCGGEYTSSSGVIRHPLSGGNYLNNEECTWIIRTANHMKITFTSFNLENYYDELYVRDGESISSDLLGEFTGSTVPSPVMTSTNAAHILFKSDYSVTRTGFEIHWEPAAEWCPLPYRIRGTECFFVSEDKNNLLNWDEAHQQCLSMGGDLAQPEDMVDFVKYIKESYPNSKSTIWLGATDRGVEQEWYWLSGEPVPAAMWTPWPHNQPSGDGDCMEIHWWPDTSFYLNDWWCHNKGHFACEINRGQEWCPSPYRIRGNECFFVSEDKNNLLNWDEAHQKCLSTGGDLAQPQDMVDFVNYIKRSYTNSKSTIWLGATDRGVEQEWYWLSGEPVPPDMWTPWPHNQPSGDGDCMEIHWWSDTSFYLNDWWCHNKGYFACEINRECECGQANRASRIVNGIETEENEYPWQAALVYSGSSTVFCGGSVIGSKHILTAAHCTQAVEDYSISYQVLVGAHGLTTASSSQIRLNALTYTQHPDYSSSTYDNDISIIELSDHIDFASSDIRPVCLPGSDSNTYDSVTATVSGWGTTESGGSQPDVLMEVDVPTMSNTECRNSYGGSITDNMLCAGYEEGGKDSCQGDSGGPLFYNSGSVFTQIGVTSWGSGCARPRYPGVYARVSKYLTWISDNSGSSNTCSEA